MMQIVALLSALVAGASAQFFSQELPFGLVPPPVQQQQFFPQQQFAASQRLAAPQQQFAAQQFAPQQNYAHRAVVQNAASEAQLPPHLLNPFYKNQRIASALAKQSWFTPGENLVIDREAEKIPRREIYKVLKNAGFVKRR